MVLKGSNPFQDILYFYYLKVITKKTKFNIVDNSGGLLGKCIQVYNKKCFAFVGEIIKVTIKKKNSKKKNLKNKIYYAIILSNTKKFSRKNGICIQFNKNRIILLSDQQKLIGTRYKGPIAKEILKYKKKIIKIISLAKKIL